MWLSIISFLGGPVVKGLIDAYNAHLKAATDDKQIASDLAGKEIAAQAAESEAINQLKIAEIGHFWEPEKLFAYTLWFYFAKVYVYDAALGLGSTDAVRGDVATWGGLVISFYFARRGFENVARITKR